MRIGVFGVVALGLLTAACGTNETQRSATGGLTGLGIGALAGGPIGALIGGAAGAVGGALMPEGADTIAENMLHKEHNVASRGLNDAGLGPASGSSQQATGQSPQTVQTVKQAQTELQREGLYHGRIDGIAGPKTKQALTAYQQREGLQQTAALDQETLQRMNLATGSARTAQDNRSITSGSGTSTPSALMTADQLRNRLQASGYSNVANVRRQSDNTYTARADWGNATYAIRADGQSGRVVSQQRIGATQGQNAPASTDAGIPTSTSNDAESRNLGDNGGPVNH